MENHTHIHIAERLDSSTGTSQPPTSMVGFWVAEPPDDSVDAGPKILTFYVDIFEKMVPHFGTHLNMTTAIQSNCQKAIPFSNSFLGWFYTELGANILYFSEGVQGVPA